MLNKIHLIILSFSSVYAFLQADEIAPDTVDQTPVAEAEPVDQTPVAEAEPVPEIPEVPENELIELVGYLTALSSGVSTLKLDEAEIRALAEGLENGIAGNWKLEDYPQDKIQAAFAQAQARATALQEQKTDTVEALTDREEPDAAEAAEAFNSETPQAPVIEKDALNKIGLVMVNQSGLNMMKFSPKDAALIKQGFIAGANATEPSPEVEAKMPAFQKFIQARVKKAQAAAAAEAEVIAKERKAAGEAFFAELSNDEDVQQSESGLHYKVLEPGADEKPTLQDTVLVHYKGTLIDGTQFDSSYDRGEPASFPLNGVVPGFGEGLTKIGAGGKITLYIPSELGYGDSPRPGGIIKPGDTLIFDCELIAVNPE